MNTVPTPNFNTPKPSNPSERERDFESEFDEATMLALRNEIEVMHKFLSVSLQANKSITRKNRIRLNYARTSRRRARINAMVKQEQKKFDWDSDRGTNIIKFVGLAILGGAMSALAVNVAKLTPFLPLTTDISPAIISLLTIPIIVPLIYFLRQNNQVNQLEASLLETATREVGKSHEKRNLKTIYSTSSKDYLKSTLKDIQRINKLYESP